MSIAVSAVVKPSRILATLVGGMYICAGCIGGLLCFAQTFGLPLFAKSFFLIGGFLIGLVGLLHTIRDRKSLHIDISGNGQIKVEEDNAVAVELRQNCLRPAAVDNGAVVRLMPGSTIWPFLMLLRLQAEDRAIKNLVILPDCMSFESFRRLCVACRWIAAHNDQAERKIL